MKHQYEDRTRYCLPRRTYTIIRIDGKAFHTYTKGFDKPFDFRLMEWMDYAAKRLCAQVSGCRLAYGQSDEYSFLLTDFATPHTEAWFDGNIQKIVSVSASIFTQAFNEKSSNAGPATFDARVFTIPDKTEVENYFIWRQQDATRNAIQSVGQAHFSPKQLHSKNVSQIQEMLFQEKKINFNDFPTNAKRGRVIKKVPNSDGLGSYWEIDTEIPIFTADREYIKQLIPEYN